MEIYKTWCKLLIKPNWMSATTTLTPSFQLVYRVNSQNTRFEQWATSVLRDYMIKVRHGWQIETRPTWKSISWALGARAFLSAIKAYGCSYRSLLKSHRQTHKALLNNSADIAEQFHYAITGQSCRVSAKADRKDNMDLQRLLTVMQADTQIAKDYLSNRNSFLEI